MTFSVYFRGRVIALDQIPPDDITVDDVAETLSKINRFAGRTPYPYPVAQHAVLCAEIAKHLELSEALQYEALHHDDCEAFFGDIIGPLKAGLVYRGAEYNSVEEKFMATHLARVFGVPEIMSAEVRHVDRLACRVEQALLQGWEDPGHYPREALPVSTAKGLVGPRHWRVAASEYEDKHRELRP